MTRVLRGDDRLVPVTVVVVATDPDHVFLRAAADAGADAVLAHPLDMPSLRARTVRVLQRTRAIRADVEADRLTGLVNRRRLDAELLRYVALADRFDQRLTFTLVDLDRFKRVNDTFGHPTGDEVLRRVAAVLRETFRGEDVVARWGGEELAIATFGMRAEDSVARVEGALQAVREHPISAPDGSEFRVTFSAGVAEYGRDAADVAGLYAAADQALYLAKATGRDRVVAAGSTDLAPPDIVDVAIVDDDVVLTDLLQRALDEHQLTHVTFSDGRRAIRRLTGDERERARVVLLDVDLPGADGHEVLDALASGAVLEETRTIMLTAQADDDHVVDTLARGAFDHIAKPFSVPVLVQRVLRALTA